jgi:hypothetical protein
MTLYILQMILQDLQTRTSMNIPEELTYLHTSTSIPEHFQDLDARTS